MLKIEVTLKFDNDHQNFTPESDLQLAVRLLAALGAKFPTTDVEAALQTLTDIGSKGTPFVLPSQALPTG